MKVIGLTGRARSGKDTVAGLIALELEGQHVIRQGFADKLKVSAARALGLNASPEDCIAFCDELKVDGRVAVQIGGDGDQAISAEVSGRTYLQRFGTEAHREVFGEDFWLDAVLPLAWRSSDSYYLDRDDCDVLVVPDVRFPNEALRVHACGGEVWRIVRPEAERVEDHASEAGVPRHLVTRSILNVGTLDDLRATVGAMLRAGVAS